MRNWSSVLNVSKASARESFFGYWPVYPRSIDVGPESRLDGFLKFSSKKRNFLDSEEIWNEGFEAGERAVAQVKVDNRLGNIPLEGLSEVFNNLFKVIRQDFSTHPCFNYDQIIEAASIGSRLGLFEKNRIGNSPPVAIGYMIGANFQLRTEAKERFDSEASMTENPMYILYTEALHSGFYAARAGLVKL